MLLDYQQHCDKQKATDRDNGDGKTIFKNEKERKSRFNWSFKVIFYYNMYFIQYRELFI